MKTKKVSLKTILVTALLSIMPMIGIAQECKAVLFMKQGAILDYTDYSKNGKKKGSTRHETINISGTSNTIDAIIEATVLDKKNKESFSTQYKANCNNGLFSVDMLRFFSLDKLSEQHQENFSLEIDGDVLEFPTNSKVGDVLDDGHINIKVNNQGFTLITMTFDIFNRKIVAEETITTPAGAFNCQKVTLDFKSKFGIIKINGSGKEWYHDNAVVIRSESYNKKRKATRVS
ncbi:TapB family protein [Aquimarina mytili]|uniref:DUF3108 domain-containing protein n=1 Tax=Aquimarina mytili TaxID=874423 RepID=A0A937A603_9FLAO|nr:hypothetical protein [Aquimarina mytili]MBL0685505.1 hypothetical protein [Aquimarina mytili]